MFGHVALPLEQTMQASVAETAAFLGDRLYALMVIAVGRDSWTIFDVGVDAAALADSAGSGASIIPISSSVRIWIAAGRTDMRKGMQACSYWCRKALVVIRSTSLFLRSRWSAD